MHAERALSKSPVKRKSELLTHASLSTVVLKDTAFQSPAQQKMFSLAVLEEFVSGDGADGQQSQGQSLAHQGREYADYSAPMIRFNVRFRLGGMLLLEGNGADDGMELDAVLRLLSGIILPHKCDHGFLYAPPFLRYADSKVSC